MYDIKALHEAENVQDAICLLTEHPQAQIIAGGSDVLVQIREGKRAGVELVSIYGLDELRGVSLEEDETLRIGSLTSFSHITKNELIQKYIPVLGEAVDMVGGLSDPQYRDYRRKHMQWCDFCRFGVYAVCVGCNRRTDRPGRYQKTSDPGVLYQSRKSGYKTGRASDRNFDSKTIISGVPGTLY